MKNLGDFGDFLEEYYERLRSDEDLSRRPLEKKESKAIIKAIAKNIKLSTSQKIKIYRKFLTQEINWIEFYARVPDFTGESVLSQITKPSIFLNNYFRQPSHTLKGRNNFLKPISFNTIQNFRHNCQLITDLDQQKDHNLHQVWEIVYLRLPPNYRYTFEQALAVLKKNDNDSVEISIDLKKKT